MSKFEELGLTAPLLKALNDLSFETPTPVQEQAIPALLDGRDVLGIAQTGTGKTAAFGLPLLMQLSQSKKRAQRYKAKALILAPTRELAAQIEAALVSYAKYLKLKMCVIVGGVGFGKQLKNLEEGMDIVIATPGRLLDHAKDGHFFFDDTHFLVMDEADRMLDMGFIADIRAILKNCPEDRQSMLFSATFSEDIRNLAERLLDAPVMVEIAANRDVSKIAQTIYQVKKEHKRDFLRDLIVDNQWRQVLIFTKLKSGAARLAKHLEKDGFTVDCIHGDRTQSARSKALAKFKSGEVQILVATDVVARGIDIKELPHVVNYDLPNNAEDYVHRIGRTGRAGMDGEAVSLMQPEDRYLLRSIERLIKKKFDVQVIDEADPADFVDEAPQKRRGRTSERSMTEGRGRPAGKGRREKKEDERETYAYATRRTDERRPTREEKKTSRGNIRVKGSIKGSGKGGAKSATPKRPVKNLSEFDYVLPGFDK